MESVIIKRLKGYKIKKLIKSGIEKNFSTLLELIRKIAFGINSATTNIINVEIMVCTIIKRKAEGIISFRLNSKICAISIPYTTKAILFPISILTIKFDSCFVKMEIIFEVKLLDFLSSSNFNLLADIKAISMPEKKADNKRVIIIRRTTSIRLVKLEKNSFISNYP